MPLYRKRFKQPLSQKHSKDIVPSTLEQSTNSQLDNIPGFHDHILNSPVYPEAFPRNASEPNESAFADEKFRGKRNETENTTLSLGNNEKESDEPQISQNNVLSKKNLCEVNENVNNLESPRIWEISSLTDSPMNELSNEIEEILSSTDKIYQSEPVQNSDISEKNNVSKSQDKENRIPKKKKAKNDKTNTQIKTKAKNTLKSDFIHPSESLNSSLDISINKTQISRDLDISLNSSKSSQMSMNDPPVKEAYKKFLMEKTTTYQKFCSQNSDVSLNDPIVKETYSQFMERKEKFGRVNTPKGLTTHYAKMEWLQKQRNVGVYVHCDRCDKIRYLEEINDPTLLPDKWYCEDNTDLQHNKCEIPQEKFPLHVQEDWIDNLYNAGSLVWARVEGYPWWPGIIDDDPDTESYYWLDDDINDTPSYYHVTFFDQKEVTRAWLKPNDIKSFHKEKNNPHMLPDKFSLFRKRVEFALKQANEAFEMPLLKRLEKFSFLVRYKKTINKPRDVIEGSKRKASKFNKKDYVKEKRRRGEGVNGKSKKTASQKLQQFDSFPNDFEIPLSPTIEDISLELFENI